MGELKLNRLFQMQKELDDRIIKEHNLSNRSYVLEKILALLVELGELANETRCFKYWSIKPSSSREIILEELVDGIHFIISLCLAKGISLSNANYLKISYVPNKDLTEDFLDLYERIIKFRKSPLYTSEKIELEKLLDEYISFGIKLGFTWEQIEQAYIDKNIVNHTRQSEGY